MTGVMVERRTHEAVLRNAIKVVSDEMVSHQAVVLARYVDAQITNAPSNARWETTDEHHANLLRAHGPKAAKHIARHLEYRNLLDTLKSDLDRHLGPLTLASTKEDP